jgi:hypothetical protein
MEGEVRRELDAFEAKLSLHNANVDATAGEKTPTTKSND